MKHHFSGDPFPAWQDLPWTAFREEDEEHPVLALQPVVALAARGPNLPLDLEWRILKASLTKAASSLSPDMPIRLLPPFERVPHLESDQVFSTGVPEATTALVEIARSIANSKVGKIAFLHVNTALGDWLDLIGRQIRIEEDCQVFNLDLRGWSLGESGEIHPDLPTATANLSASQTDLADTLREILAFPGPDRPKARSLSQ